MEEWPPEWSTSQPKRKHQVPMGLARCFPEGKEARFSSLGALVYPPMMPSCGALNGAPLHYTPLTAIGIGNLPAKC